MTVTSDEYVRRGPGRPVFSQEMRMATLAALECVDWVVLSEDTTALDAMGVGLFVLLVGVVAAREVLSKVRVKEYLRTVLPACSYHDPLLEQRVPSKLMQCYGRLR